MSKRRWFVEVLEPQNALNDGKHYGGEISYAFGYDDSSDNWSRASKTQHTSWSLEIIISCL